MAEQTFEIPLINVPQSFEIELAGRSLSFVNKWNGEMGLWMLDISDSETEEDLITSLPIVSGADLLAQLQHIGIPGKLIAYTSGDELSPPTESNLGTQSKLYYVVEVE